LLAAAASALAAVPSQTQPAGSPGSEPTTPQTLPAQKRADPFRQRLDKGWQSIRFADYSEAQKTLSGVLAEADSPEAKAEALFALGHLRQHRKPKGDPDEARDCYRRAFEEYPQAPAAPWALLSLARMADLPPVEADRDRRAARRLYRKTIDAAPHHPAADEAALRLAMTYIEEVRTPAEQEKGARILLEHLKSRPGSYLAPVMHVMIANLRRDRRQWREAVDHWIAAAESSRASARDESGRPKRGAAGVAAESSLNTSHRAGLYYQIACAAQKHLRDFALAAEWYERLMTEIPRDGRYFVAKMAAQEMHMALAEAAVRKGQFRRAVEHWIAVERLDLADHQGNVGKARALSDEERCRLYFRIGQTAERQLADPARAAVWYARVLHSTKQYGEAQAGVERCRRLTERQPHPSQQGQR
jgi:tetratricopeptide (TPR) repeat protein